LEFIVRFVDEVKIEVEAGDGGHGIVAWRREKYVPKGGPAGGDGGNGGSVKFVADESMHSLLDFRYNPLLRAQKGGMGLGKGMHGKNGKDFIARVPVGTQIYDFESEALIIDLVEEAQEAIVAIGGSGGHGNARFSSSTRRAPDFAKQGYLGEKRTLKLSLKVLADVGLLGYPNAGKSTLLSVISAARPKVADYPFTTLTPQLGVVQVELGKSFVMADIPGLIEGAAEGAGLGIQFLKHLERVRVICHLIEPLPEWMLEDGELSDADKLEKLKEKYQILRAELNTYSEDLAGVPEIVVLTKKDLLNTQEDHQGVLSEFKEFLGMQGTRVFEISAAQKEGLRDLVFSLWDFVKREKGINEDDKSFDPIANNKLF
jgi:GTP-binding protein